MHLQQLAPSINLHLILQHYCADIEYMTHKFPFLSHQDPTFPKYHGHHRRGVAAHHTDRRDACSHHKHGRTFLSPPPWK